MPMPHAEMKRLIQRRLRGTDGAERLKVARECMAMLPGYKQGPYADLRKWLTREMETTRKRREVRHADGTFVPREGDARIVLLGPPNAGKSSLLKGLCGSSVKVGDYAFTTLRPIAATAVINEARIQLVEIPGLIEGAREDRGSGRMYLAAAQDADGYLVVMPLEDSSGFERFLEEIQHILEGQKFAVAATKADLPGADAILEAAHARFGFAGITVVPVSTATGSGLDALAEALWTMTGLMRIYSAQSPTDRPFLIPSGSTVADLAAHIHLELARELDRAAIWGPSAKFPGQVVGKSHVLQDTDKVRLFKRKG
jgi:small GTP-binding protein